MAYHYFKQYAAFLLENHLDELTNLNLERAKAVQLPALALFKDYSPVQLFDYSKKSIQKLLEELVQEKALKSALENINRWKTGQMPGVPRDKLNAKDMAFSPAIRRYAFIKLLRRYTQDLAQYEAIVQDIDHFYTDSLAVSLQAYLEVQQEELQKERDFFQTVIDHTVDGITAYDKELRITLWNRSVEQRTGLDRHQVLGKRMVDFFPDYANSPDMQAMVRALQGERAELRDMPYREKSGFYESDLVPLRDSQQGIVGVLAISRDTTEQKKITENIARSEAIMAQAQSAAHFGSWELDLASGELRWSDEMYRILGYEPRSIPVTYPWLREQTHAEDVVATDDLLAKVIANPQAFEFSQRIRRKDASYCLIYVKGGVMTDETGQAVRLFGASQDVTQQRQTEEQLRRSESYLKEAQAMAHVGYWEIDLLNDRMLWSDELYRIHGIALGTTIDIDVIKKLVHPDYAEALLAWINQATAGEEVGIFEHQVIDRHGQVKVLRSKGEVEKDREGRIVRIKGISQDITDHRLAQQEIVEKNKELSQALEELRSAQDSLIELNNELERRVQQRTQELSASEEELRHILEQAVELNITLREQESFLSSIIDQSPFSTFIADKQGTLIRLNQACVDLFGLQSEDQAIGKYNILQDNVLVTQPFYPDIEAVFREGKVARFEVVNYNVNRVQHMDVPTGKPVSIVVTIFPIRDYHDNVINAVVQHADVTEQKNAEQALKASEKQLRLVTDALPVLIAYIDSEVHYRFNNKAYEEWFGISRSDLYGKHLRDIVGEEAYKGIQHTVQRALSGEQFRYEAWLHYKTAGRRFVSVDYIPHINEQGKVLGYYTLVNDITEQKQAQQALEDALNETNRKNEELKKINIDLDNFVYTASHDLKSPIANLEGITSILGKRLTGKLDEKEIQLIDMINKMTVKLKGTIKDLTEITKVQKAFDQEMEPVYFAEILEDITADIQPLMNESGAEVLTHFEVEGLNYARKNLRSVLYNLVINGIKYQSPDRKPLIYVRTRQEGAYILLTVEDNGLGIPENQLYKLFLMFKRLHTHVEGSGIGLYITKRIIENNGGRIEVESQEGVGTTFKVFFKA